MMIAGRIPLRNRSPIETLATTPYSTMVILGGTTNPRIPDEATTAAESA